MKSFLSVPVSIVMPVCNEIDIIEDVVNEWHREVMQYLPQDSEMLFDDGHSTDGTTNALERLRQKYPYVRVMYSQRDGFAASARRLYTQARCPYIFFTDSDGQYVPAEFWKVAALAEGTDVVHGAKINRQDPALRKLASAVFNWIATMFFGTQLNDINSAFRLQRREVINHLLPQTRCMPMLLNAELLMRAEAAGYTIKQVDVAHRPRVKGVSRGLPPRRFAWECWRAYRGLLKLRRELPAASGPEKSQKVASARIDQ